MPEIIKPNTQDTSFQGIIFTLQQFWAERGCIITQPYNTEVGAGTLHPATTLRALGSKPWNVAYVQPSIRPKDGRYGDNPNRLYQHHQFQIILKPSPDDIQDIYLKSIELIGIDPLKHDIRFVEDDWENPSIGAWGLGWEVWCDGMEITQFTYMQQVGSIECAPVSGEITLGLERLIMYIQGVDNVYDLAINNNGVTYGDIYHQFEREFSAFALDYSDTDMLFRHFNDVEGMCRALLDRDLPLPAYDFCLKASHLLNLLDARGVIGQTERASYLLRVRTLAKACCQKWLEHHE